MRRAKVSLGIPVYNEVHDIRYTLMSAVKQGAEQVIISDNASTDGTSEICQEFATQHPCITYFKYETTQPVTSNFMNCLALAEHEYFMIMGGHDFLSQNYVYKLRKILDKTDSVLAYSNAVHMTAHHVFKRFYEYTFADALRNPSPQQRLLAIVSELSDCTMYYGLYRKDVFAHALGAPEHAITGGIDHGMLARVALAGTMTLCPDVTFYRINPPRRERTAEEKWQRVLQATYADKYDPQRHVPELIPIGIVLSQFRLARFLVSNNKEGRLYLSNILRSLLKRWAIFDNVLGGILPEILPVAAEFGINMPTLLQEDKAV